jgi:hypothetical protein
MTRDFRVKSTLSIRPIWLVILVANDCKTKIMPDTDSDSDLDDPDSDVNDSERGFDDSDSDSDNNLSSGSVVKMSGALREGDVLPVTIGRRVWYVDENDIDTTEKFETAMRIASSSG